MASTILCIDDRQESTTIRKQLLETKGYAVLTANDGPSGIALLRKHPIDAIVLDYQMPRMNGDEVAHVIKQEYPTLPIVLLSGVLYENPERLLYMVDAFVQKGEHPEAFLSAVERVLKGRKKKQPSGQSSDAAAIASVRDAV
jgi:CheY-like chemotaxis protein